MGSPPGSRTDTAPRIRSYAARRGRLSDLTRERLDTLLPPRLLADGPLDPVAAYGRRAPLVLEIGCGHGAAAVAYAAAHPGHDLLAVDVHPPGIARMLAAAQAAGVANLRVAMGDAVALLETRVGAGTLTAVHVFFPDPWPKAKHAKRRLVRPSFLELAHDRLVPDGRLLLATDSASYADHALAVLAADGGFEVTLGERPAWRPVEGFEAKGLAAGRVVTEISARRR